MLLNIKFTSCDNTGARVVKCIGVARKSIRNLPAIGDTIKVVVQTLHTGVNVGASKKAQAHKIYNAVVVRTRRPLCRNHLGTVLFFDDNAVVLRDKDKKPIGDNFFGMFPQKEREAAGYKSLVMMVSRDKLM